MSKKNHRHEESENSNKDKKVSKKKHHHTESENSYQQSRAYQERSEESQERAQKKIKTKRKSEPFSRSQKPEPTTSENNAPWAVTVSSSKTW